MLTPFTENYLGLKDKNVCDIPWFVTTVFSLLTSKLTGSAQKAFAFVHCYLLSSFLAQEVLLNEWLREIRLTGAICDMSRCSAANIKD